MRASLIASLVLTAATLFAVTAPTASCGPSNDCSPKAHGFDVPVLAIRKLPGRGPLETACARPRLEIISNEADLKRFYDEISPGGDLPTVDFTKERVIVREDVAHEGISWAVADGELGVVGLLACIRDSVAISCTDQVIAVPAMITRVETRTCNPVQCGNPIQPPSAR